MRIGRAIALAAVLVGAMAAPAWAQFPNPQGQFSSPQVANPQQQCEQFIPLREDVEKKGAAIEAAIKRKAPPQEACKLLKSFEASEAKLVKFAEGNGAWCGMPSQVVTQIKSGHARTIQARTNACAAASAATQRAPAPPTLGDVLGTTRIPDASNTRTGRGGTYNTLSGNPVAR